MINTLSLGNKTFHSNLIQGPLAGVSSMPFRLLTWRYSKPAFTCTEMISCKTIIHQSKHFHERYLSKDPEEGPVCFQLSANNPHELAEAVKYVTDDGADLIDLNCGCPVKKIRGKGAGSKLLSDAGRLYDLITAMKQNTHLPVSIKIRVDGNSNEKFNEEIAQAVSDAGADFLIVHGRHWTEHYETSCRHDEIQFFVERMTIPVIGNGDVGCLQSLKNMIATGCAGIMIGRASVGQPWLISKLSAEYQNQSFTPPSSKEIAAIFIEHVERLAALLKSEKFAILQARKIAKYYARHIDHKNAYCEAINHCQTMQEFVRECESYF